MLIFLAMPLPASESEGYSEEISRADLQIEYGIDSLERRYYHPRFRFKFPFKKGNYFLEVEYHSRLNGRLQGAIDYWINTGADFRVNRSSTFRFSLNHFCRHQTGRQTFYVWNFNELLAQMTFSRKKLQLSLGGGTYLGGSDIYRYLLTAGLEKEGLIIPELKLEARFKLVNFDRLFYHYGLAISLSESLELFYRRSRDYEFEPVSYIGVRFDSSPINENQLQFLKLVPGFFLADNEHKLELAGLFRFSLLKKELKQLIVDLNFSTPVFSGRTFWAEFNPEQMNYSVSLEYERKFSKNLYLSWLSIYRLSQPVDLDLPFKASLFSGLLLKNQSNFDLLDKKFRFQLAAGYDFKRGFSILTAAALTIASIKKVFFWNKFEFEIDRNQKNFSFWLFVTGSNRPEIRPFVCWRREWLKTKPDNDLLVGIGLFFPGQCSER